MNLKERMNQLKKECDYTQDKSIFFDIKSTAKTPLEEDDVIINLKQQLNDIKIIRNNYGKNINK